MTCEKRRKLCQIPHLIHPSHCQDLSLSLSLGHVHAPTTTSEVTPVIGPEAIQMSSTILFVQGPCIACYGSSHFFLLVDQCLRDTSLRVLSL